ncbi:MAG: polysaccharide biosynthesis protein, partial [Butyricimonas faecihominis]
NKENTLPTDHNKIRVAKVREYNYFDVVNELNKLNELAARVNIPDMVKMMKDIVPEFVSRNSEFEKYDKESVS